MPTSTPGTGTLRTTALSLHFERLGPMPARRPRNPVVYEPVRILIPRHTAMSIDAMIGYITEPLRRHVRMLATVDLGPRFTVTIDLDAESGKFVVNGGRDGNGRIEVHH
jgi:hypothetical protein